MQEVYCEVIFTKFSEIMPFYFGGVKIPFRFMKMWKYKVSVLGFYSFLAK